MDASAPPAALDEAYAFCESQVKDGDRTAWLAALFAPADKRPAFHALSAFALEASAVRSKVREPLAGELRLQWWTDAIEGEARGDVRGHPVAAALLDTIRRYDLSRSALTGYLDVKRTDLYDDPIPSLRAFDERADRSEGAVFAARAEILIGLRDSAANQAAQHAGRALAVLEGLRDLCRPATPLAARVPLDILEAAGVATADLQARSILPGVEAAVARLCLHAAAEIAALRLLRRSLDSRAAAAFLTASLVEPTLRRATSSGFDPFVDPLALPQWRTQWFLWRAAKRGGIR